MTTHRCPGADKVSHDLVHGRAIGLKREGLGHQVITVASLGHVTVCDLRRGAQDSRQFASYLDAIATSNIWYDTT